MQRIDIYSYYASMVVNDLVRLRKDKLPTIEDITHGFDVAEAIVEILNKK
jgi:hypothetical protein